MGKVIESKNWTSSFIIDQNDITNFSLPKRKKKKEIKRKFQVWHYYNA